jgi:hypothetical protein
MVLAAAHSDNNTVLIMETIISVVGLVCVLLNLVL